MNSDGVGKRKMDSFSIIQNFFTRMRCNFCSHHFEPGGIQLLREEHGTYIVNVYCTFCERQVGIAMVGLEGQEGSLSEQKSSQRQYSDPELTEAELERLSSYQPINYDDVLNAHQFFTNLDAGWMKHLPPEMLPPETRHEQEFPEDEALH
jgi:hypothetical protein